MTSAQVRELALKLYAMIFGSDERAEQAIRLRCLRSFHDRGLEPTIAALISDALMGYLYGSRPQTLALVTSRVKAQAVLSQTMSGSADVRHSERPISARLTSYAIATMVEWVLAVGIYYRESMTVLRRMTRRRATSTAVCVRHIIIGRASQPREAGHDERWGMGGGHQACSLKMRGLVAARHTHGL
jgi:hypothetical protein